ncbi:hypothetical protein ACJRO7_031752 [Eucalyptus globulus]|uniref:Pentatricopeptide repeat-containing protein n=1 Tax=Eucalyptus globulus TaxID=34317 RepID=A0ABD3JKJ7_EUCGL
MAKNRLVPDWSTFNNPLSSLIQSGSFDKVWRLFNDFTAKVRIITEWSLGIMANSCCEAGPLDRAFEIFARLKELNLWLTYTCELGLVAKRKTYRVLLDGYLRKGKTGDGLELYRKMKLSGVAPSVHTCNLMINVLCKRGDQGIIYSAVTFNILIRGLSHDSVVWENLVAMTNLLKEMGERGISLSKVTHTILVSAYVRSDDMEKGFDIYSSLQKARFTLDVHTYGVLKMFKSIHDECIEANYAIYSTPINGYYKEDSSYRALS